MDPAGESENEPLRLDFDRRLSGAETRRHQRTLGAVDRHLIPSERGALDRSHP